MTLERFIGYSGFVLIIIHVIPFSHTLVLTLTIIISVGLILSGTYLRWRNKIRTYIESDKGHMTIPRFFERLEAQGRAERKRIQSDTISTR